MGPKPRKGLKTKRSKVITEEFYKRSMVEEDDFRDNMRIENGVFTCTEENCKFECITEDEVFAKSHRAWHRKERRKVRVKKVKKRSECQLCRENFPDSKSLHKHFRQRHAGASYNCPRGGCEKSFLQKKRFNEHMRSHEKSFSCDICLKKFGRRGDFNSHMKKFHGAATVLTKLKKVSDRDAPVEDWEEVLEDAQRFGESETIVTVAELFVLYFPTRECLASTPEHQGCSRS